MSRKPAGGEQHKNDRMTVAVAIATALQSTIDLPGGQSVDLVKIS